MTETSTRILALETSCDETAAAVVENGSRTLSSVIASQSDLHAQYGGVFPEVASRQHIETVYAVVDQAMNAAHLGFNDVDAIAVTRGPGLVGSLLVGLNLAKGLALARQKPLLGINHIEGHIYSLWLTEHEPEIEFPILNLIVSGGHTELYLMTGHGEYSHLGGTLDDAAGEAFDKVGRLFGLPFPGGPHIDDAAREGNPTAFRFPRALLNDSFDFSFSGLKTAVLRVTKRYDPERMPVADLAASFQAAVVDVLVKKTVAAAETYEAAAIHLTGGVSANSALRASLTSATGRTVRFPPQWLCTDNAAMIGAAAFWRFEAGQRDPLDLDVSPGLRLT